MILIIFYTFKQPSCVTFIVANYKWLYNNHSCYIRSRQELVLAAAEDVQTVRVEVDGLGPVREPQGVPGALEYLAEAEVGRRRDRVQALK